MLTPQYRRYNPIHLFCVSTVLQSTFLLDKTKTPATISKKKEAALTGLPSSLVVPPKFSPAMLSHPATYRDPQKNIQAKGIHIALEGPSSPFLRSFQKR